VGGLETIMAVLAEEFVAAGHCVKVVTVTDGDRDLQNSNYEIHRSPKLPLFIRLLRWSDVCLTANVSLRALGPMLLARRPIVLSHHGFYDGSFASMLKRMVARTGTNICVSHAVQSTIPGKSIVVPNAYRTEIFKQFDDVVQDLDIIFVGRLVSSKGVADLIDVLRQLAGDGIRPRLSIVGDGPERAEIEQKVNELGLAQQVTFTGSKSGIELARFVARHRVMSVPSRGTEGFGIVALEGIACGCAVVGTNLGGIPEAIGQCGVTVPNGDIVAMAKAIESLLKSEDLRLQYRSYAAAHLAAHSRATMANRYLAVLSAVSDRHDCGSAESA